MRIFLFILCLLLPGIVVADEYIGKFSSNPYNADSTSNPHGQPLQRPWPDWHENACAPGGRNK